MPLQKVRKVIKMPLKSLFLCCKISNIAQGLGLHPQPRSVTCSSCISLFSTKPKLDNFCAKIITFVSPLFNKILVARWAAFTAADKVFKRLRQGRNSEGDQDERRPPYKNFAHRNPKATIGENFGRPK